MKKQRLFLFSLFLNVFLILFIAATGFVYRDKIIQRFVRMKGSPKIVMLGNSITAQGKWVELLGRTDVMTRGFSGQCTYHFLKLMQANVIDMHPKVCFVMGGINDITVGVAPDRIESNYRTILERLVKNHITPVVTLTLYEQDDPISKHAVANLNRFLIQYCADQGITYIDLNQYIADSTGLKAAYAVDKTHLNPAAYRIWAREITRVLKQKGI